MGQPDPTHNPVDPNPLFNPLKMTCFLPVTRNLIDSTQTDPPILPCLFTSPSTINLMLETFLFDCRKLLRAFLNSTMTHIFKEANRCANSLAKIGNVQLIDFYILNEPLSMVEPLLTFDKLELFCNKFICDSLILNIMIYLV